MYIRLRTQYEHINNIPMDSRNTRTYNSERIHFEHICCLEKNILFLLCPEKNILAFRLRNKILWFSIEENKRNLEEKNKNKNSHALPLPHRKSNGRFLIVYKSGLARCGGNLCNPVTLNFNSICLEFFFIYILISIRVTGSKFVPG